MCLPYAPIEDAFATIVQRWVDIRTSEKAPIFSLWPMILRSNRVGVERALLARTQFLDAILPGTAIGPQNEFERVRDAVLSAIPLDASQPVAEAIRNGIARANQGSFKDRISAAVAQIPSNVRSQYGLDEEMIRALRDLRNALTHTVSFRKSSLEHAVATSARAQIVAISYMLLQIWPGCSLLSRLRACREWYVPFAFERL
jgi:hypothetical protein